MTSYKANVETSTIMYLYFYLHWLLLFFTINKYFNLGDELCLRWYHNSHSGASEQNFYINFFGGGIMENIYNIGLQDHFLLSRSKSGKT